MEKYDISLLHHKVYHLTLEVLKLFNSKVSLVDFTISRVRMIIEFSKVGLGANMKTTIFNGAVLKGSPGSDNSVGRTEGKVGQILVRRMSRADSHMRRFIDEHGMNRFDIFSTEALEVRNEVRIGAVGLEDVVKLEILNLGDIFLTNHALVVVLMFLGKRYIPHYLHTRKAVYKSISTEPGFDYSIL